MTQEFNYVISDKDNDFLFVEVEGVAEPHNLLALYESISNYSKHSGLKKVLINFQGVSFDYPITELIPLSQKVATLASELKVARLCEMYDYRQDLIQNLCVKLDILIKNFTCSSQAQDWLLAD